MTKRVRIRLEDDLHARIVGYAAQAADLGGDGSFQAACAALLEEGLRSSAEPLFTGGFADRLARAIDRVAAEDARDRRLLQEEFLEDLEAILAAYGKDA